TLEAPVIERTWSYRIPQWPAGAHSEKTQPLIAPAHSRCIHPRIHRLVALLASGVMNINVVQGSALHGETLHHDILANCRFYQISRGARTIVGKNAIHVIAFRLHFVDAAQLAQALLPVCGSIEELGFNYG